MQYVAESICCPTASMSYTKGTHVTVHVRSFRDYSAG